MGAWRRRRALWGKLAQALQARMLCNTAQLTPCRA